MPPRCSPRALVAFAFALVTSFGLASAARADEPETSPAEAAPPMARSGIEAMAGLFAGSYMHPPVVDGLSPSRPGSVQLAAPLSDQTFRSATAATMMGLDLQAGWWTRGDRVPIGINVPLVGFRAALATSGDDVAQGYTIDGVDSNLSLGPGGFYEITLPGIGVDVVTRSIYFRAAVQLSFQHFWMSGRLTQGALEVDVSASSDTFGVDGTADLCARIGSSFGCAYVTPLLWRSGTEQDHLVNGVLVGIAWHGLDGV